MYMKKIEEQCKLDVRLNACNFLVFGIFSFFPDFFFSNYFCIKNRKNIFGCFFHLFCATDLNFGTKNNGRLKLSTLTTQIFAIFDLQYSIHPNPGNIFMAVFIDLCPCLFTTELCKAQLFTLYTLTESADLGFIPLF